MAAPHHIEPPRSYRRLCRTWRAYLKDRLAHPLLDQQWPQCAAVESMNRDQLLALQSRRLNDLLRHVVQHVPYYREWAASQNIDAGDTVPFDQLPVVSKRDYLAQPDAFISDTVDPRSLRTHRTSGSSGEPLAVKTDAETRDYSYACLQRALFRHGIRPGHRKVHIWGTGRPKFDSKLKARLYGLGTHARDWLASSLPISAYDLSDDRMPSVVRQVERFNPDYIHGYVSALHALAMYLLRHNRTLNAPRLKLAVNDAEKLHAHQRTAMEQAFGCRVVEHYGCLEIGNVAQEDSDGHLRINEDYVLLERSPEGEAIVTHLIAKAMPFIRYRIGDLIEFEGGIAPGLPYQSLRSIEGRTTDLLPVIAGGYVHGLAIATAVYARHPEIRRYQVRQREIGRFEIAIVADELADSVRGQIVAAVRGLTGQATRVEIKLVKDIPREASGKFKLVVSDVQ